MTTQWDSTDDAIADDQHEVELEQCGYSLVPTGDDESDDEIQLVGQATSPAHETLGKAWHEQAAGRLKEKWMSLKDETKDMKWGGKLNSWLGEDKKVVPTDDQEKSQEKESMDALLNEEGKPTAQATETATVGETAEDGEADQDLAVAARKAGVAVAGGALIAVGIPLIPLPGPGDWMVLGGMALLATEFPAAQRVLDGTRQHLSDALDKHEQSEEQQQESANDDDSEPNTDQSSEKTDLEHATIKVQEAMKVSGDALKKHAHRVGRNVVLPLLDTVCTPTENGEDSNPGAPADVDQHVRKEDEATTEPETMHESNRTEQRGRDPPGQPSPVVTVGSDTATRQFYEQPAVIPIVKGAHSSDGGPAYPAQNHHGEEQYYLEDVPLGQI